VSWTTAVLLRLRRRWCRFISASGHLREA
jgi:hypothetical protein